MRRFHSLFLLFLCLPLAPAQTRIAADLGRAVIAAGLDASEFYRVRDLENSEQDARF